ncbi:hypothetical protein [Thorsellia anophelis]|uniref:DnaJ domain-containing protein n=1 Tax=Thorsellia anophelis DSM 18579 TaxID=1123402 RepID=A0A1I0ASW4_9GAMM|nr:hypothetical protein [Thorsellia anophelis]SES96638.1 hypothetical protein SAMN02583745_01021 [Thorsellia anophelis DSM 18579]
MSKLKNQIVNHAQITEKSKDKWNEVNKLWQKIEKSEAKYQNYEKDKKAFYEQVNAKLGMIEYQYTQLVKESIYELLKFIPYKSLNEDRFEVLNTWIDKLYEQIASNPFNVGEKVITVEDAQEIQNKYVKERFKKFNSHLDIEFDDSEDEYSEFNNAITMFKVLIEEMYGEVPEFTKRQWLAIILTPDRVNDIFSDMFFEVDEEVGNEKNEKGTFDFTDEDIIQAKEDAFAYENEPDIFEQFFTGFNSFDKSGHDSEGDSDENITPSPEVKAMLKNEEINKIYRQLAHKFHPDKIADEENRQLYSDLMQKLTVAKKNKDIYVIIEMAIEYLPEFDLELSDETYTAIILSLKNKLREVEEQNRRQQYDNSHEGIVWRRFRQKSDKKTTKVLDDHVKYIEGKMKNIHELFFEEKMTIKKLKKVLEQVKIELLYY